MEKTIRSVNFAFAASLFTVTLFISQMSKAQASLELSCRVKAKELAAETYKGCMTEARQSQIEQIRKDYKEKLSDLKNHYDKELKKLSSHQEDAGSGEQVKSRNENRRSDKKTKQRISGARMPQKKQQLDFNSNTSEESQVGTVDQPVEAQSVEVQTEISRQTDNKADSKDELEVVELPAQQ